MIYAQALIEGMVDGLHVMMKIDNPHTHFILMKRGMTVLGLNGNRTEEEVKWLSWLGLIRMNVSVAGFVSKMFLVLSVSRIMGRLNVTIRRALRRMRSSRVRSTCVLCSASIGRNDARGGG